MNAPANLLLVTLGFAALGAYHYLRERIDEKHSVLPRLVQMVFASSLLVVMGGMLSGAVEVLRGGDVFAGVLWFSISLIGSVYCFAMLVGSVVLRNSLIVKWLDYLCRFDR